MNANGWPLTKKQYQSLLEILFYIQKCVKPARAFINIVLALFRVNYDKNNIFLNEDLHKDIQWFLLFLPSFNGINCLDKPGFDDSHCILTLVSQVWVLSGQIECMLHKFPISSISEYRLYNLKY